jgi:hypothetical protein
MFEKFTCPKCGGHDFAAYADGTRRCKEIPTTTEPGVTAGTTGQCRFSWRVEDDAKYIKHLSERIDAFTNKVDGTVGEIDAAAGSINRLAGKALDVVERLKKTVGPATKIGRRDVPRR